MTGNDYFKINGVSSDTIDVYVDTPSVPPMAKQKYTVFNTGADETSTIPDDVFEDIPYNLTFYSFFADDFDNRDVYSLFAGAKTLEISRLSGFYYNVRQVSVTATGKYEGQKIKYTASFKLAPFRRKTSDASEAVSNPATIVNGGTRYCKPVYTFTNVTGSSLTLNVNGVPFTMTGLTAPKVIVDAERYMVIEETNGVQSVSNYKSVGQFPFFSVGTNIVSWTGSASLAVKKNERWY